MMLPWLLIVLGTIFLLENLGLIPMLDWSIVWPILLILAGGYMMKKRNGDCCGWMKKKEDKPDKN
jgi:hypothetical protein